MSSAAGAAPRHTLLPNEAEAVALVFERRASLNRSRSPTGLCHCRLPRLKGALIIRRNGRNDFLPNNVRLPRPVLLPAPSF